MREFFRSRFFKVIILVFALLLGFMIYAISQNGFGAVSSQIIGTVTAPFQKLSSYISETATDFFGKFVNAEEISRQNEELRQQIAELRDQLVDYGEVKRENDVLREQLGIKTADPSLELVSAAVVARDPAEQQFGSFTIDKGTQHGIHNSDVVITSEGLVGVVTEAVSYTHLPISVLPEYQRQGCGKALIEASFRKAAELGYDVVVIFGNPGNYVGRGFKSCKKYNVCLENGSFPTAMLVKELAPGVLDGRKWIYRDSPAMRFDESAAEQFDQQFEPMDKRVQPSQEEFYIYSHSSLQG